VIATYNRCSDLKKCIDSLSNLTVKPYEIIVADSNSTDGTRRLKDSYPIRYISIDHKNRQVARNAGISVAEGEIMAFLDDDVVVDEEWLKWLLQPYSDSNVGGVGGRVIPHGEPKDFFHPVKHSEIGKVRKNGMVLGNFDTPTPEQIEVDTLQGCNMSFKKELLLKIGGFDENFEGNCFRDDTDLCFRVRNLGYKLVYQPKALVWHMYKGRIADKSWIYWYVRNNTYFYLKNIFPEAKSHLPLFLIRQCFPPRDYARKSGVKVRFNAATPFAAIKGLADGLSQSLARKHQPVWSTC
jgi:GT2 family glycosyltransferase